MGDLDDEIIALANRGLRLVEIAENLGLSRTGAARRMSRLMGEGKLRRAAQRRGSADNVAMRVDLLRERYQIKTGHIGKALGQLDMEQSEWLFEQVPPGMTVAEYLMALVRDAYEEDSE